MAKTPNHGYNVPNRGDQEWHKPLNDNFQQYDTDIEIRDKEANKGDYTPKSGAKFLATDTGIIYTGDGSNWVADMILGKYEVSGGTTSVVFGTDAVQINGDIEVSGTKNFVQAVKTDVGRREVVYTASEAPVPRTEISGVGQLEDGRTEISLPDHFGWVSDEGESLVVHTTPYASDSAGLAVIERSVNQLVIEDCEGSGDYEFAYTVKATRKGQESQEIIRQPESE